MRRVAALVAVATCIACAEPQGDASAAATDSEGEPEDTATGGVGSLGGLAGSGPHRRCVAPPGVVASPTTIAEAVELLNALPPPVDVACFVQSLRRPLFIHATASTFSAQPSLGPQDPRVFIFSGDLVMSIVSGGDGVRLLEFGEFVDETHTIKAEVELPHEGPVQPEDPYEQVLFQNGTNCGLCHHEERAVPQIGYAPAFSSLALRPTRDHELEIEEVLANYERCDWDQTPQRCQILSALFAHGEVSHRNFPDHIPTIED